MRPVALPPSFLVVFHLHRLGRTRRTFGEPALETTFAALPDAPHGESGHDEHPSRSGPAIHANMGRLAQVIPFLSEGLGGLLVDLRFGGGVSTAGSISSLSPPTLPERRDGSIASIPDDIDAVV